MKLVEDIRKAKIKLDGKAHGLFVSNQNFPGVDMEWVCPYCYELDYVDLEVQYFHLPPINQEFDFILYCHHCENESQASLKINVDIEVV